MSDSRVQAGAPPAAPAADGPAGKSQRPRPTGEDHQHHAGHHYCHPGLCLHCCQVRRPADEEPVPRGSNHPGGVLFDRLLEELGPFTVCYRQVVGTSLGHFENTININPATCNNLVVSEDWLYNLQQAPSQSIFR